MGLKREIFVGGYVDKDGLVSPNQDGGSNNGVMYTGEFVVLLKRNDELTPAMQEYWKSSMAQCEIKKGIVRRSPSNDRDDEGPDDYHGYLCGAKLCDPSRARAFLWYGICHLGFYDSNKKLSFKDFMWRFPQMITHALFAAGWPVGIFRIFFIGSLLYHFYKDVPVTNQDARRLGWLLIQNWDGKGLLSKWAVKKWTEKLMREYPNGMKDVYGSYYQARHPFITYVPII